MDKEVIQQIAAEVVARLPDTGYGWYWFFYASCCINRKTDGGLELPLNLVQERLGHSTALLTSDRYGHLFPRGDDGAELAAAERALLG
jgi:integrase